MSRPGYPKLTYDQEVGHYTWTTLPPGSGTSNHSHSGPLYVKQREDSIGGNSPNWPLVKSNNSYAGYRFKGKASLASWHGEAGLPVPTLKGEGTYPFLSILGFDPSPLFNASDLEASLTTEVTSKLQTRIKSQKINVAVTIAEFRKTCGTVTSAAQRIASAIQNVKRGNMGGAFNTLLGGRGSGGQGGNGRGRKPRPRVPPSTGSVSKDWLALQYGWLPLLNDVYGATEELARSMTYRPPAERVTAGGKREKVYDHSFTSSNSFPSTQGTIKFRSSAKGSIEYRVSNQTAQLAANTGVMNPYAVAWELIPYSFVVDWFLPVGSYLNNLDYDLGLDFVRGWISFKSEVSGRFRAVGGTYQGNTDAKLTWSGGSYEASVQSFVRKVLISFPSVPVPEFKDPLSLKHVANALALLRSAF